MIKHWEALASDRSDIRSWRNNSKRNGSLHGANLRWRGMSAPQANHPQGKTYRAQARAG